MQRMQDDCVDCGRPEYCGSCELNKYAQHFYCDRCGCELDPSEVYDEDGQDLCEDCLKELHLKEVDALE